MRVFYSNDFRGHWPVGTAAVIVARDLDEAYVLLTSQLIAMGLGKDNDFTVVEVPTDSSRCIVLQDGEY
jgi:hypothetical protein